MWARVQLRGSSRGMAPATRPATAASAAASGPCRLLALSDDEVSVVAHELCDPLRPLLAVNLSSTAKGLRTAMQPALAELRLQRQAAEAFAALWGKGVAWMRDTKALRFGHYSDRPLSLAHWGTLSHLVGCRSLPRLERLHIQGADCGDEGAALLAVGLRRGGLPSLFFLSFNGVQLGDQGAAALATALTKRALPALEALDLEGNQLGDAGLIALAPALRRLVKLQALFLEHNQIGDRGVASLLAKPLEGVLPSLSTLSLHDNPASLEAQVAVRASAKYGVYSHHRASAREGVYYGAR